MSRLAIRRAARIVRGGGVIAYPTEAVFGLGCLPRDRAAVARVLAIKRRSWRKGLILIGANLAQLERYVVLPAEPRRSEVARDLARAPSPGCSTRAPTRRAGSRAAAAASPCASRRTRSRASSVARVGEALVSTSANVSRRPPHRRLLRLRRDLGAARRLRARRARSAASRTHGHQGRPHRPDPAHADLRASATRAGLAFPGVSHRRFKRPIPPGNAETPRAVLTFQDTGLTVGTRNRK